MFRVFLLFWVLGTFYSHSGAAGPYGQVAQEGRAYGNLAPTPPMGFMTWNYFGINVDEKTLKNVADAMVNTGLRDLGYHYLFIDDGWQGGRDNKNNIIPDPKKFPSGMKALADYVHTKGMKIGIYSDSAPLTCAGFTASLHFEEQDAKTFADWGIDYLKYDYCGAPKDRETAEKRYHKMAKALQNSGRNIVLAACEWGDRKPWLWAKNIGAQLWRTTGDIRDKWKSLVPYKNVVELHSSGFGILDILNINAELNDYAGGNGWNDPDMLIAGLYGKKDAPSSDLGGTGCTDIEYRSQMSLWCLMSAPLMISCDVADMNKATANILTNKDLIAIDQDVLGKQAKRIINEDTYQVFVKPLSNGDMAVGILNVSDTVQTYLFNPEIIGVSGKKKGKDLWGKETFEIQALKYIKMLPHETKVYRFSDD